MREVNFSIPSANKASVGITTALYDRRALDCTSTLPLVNSLNHLAYLTTSSARIRDILTVDGGVERLVCILKDGRSKEMLEMWKWNLAFQCLVNIGVRGSENVRTRVVEADMVPVIATILDNYIKVHDKCREKAEAELKRTSAKQGGSSRYSRSSKHVETFHSSERNLERHAERHAERNAERSRRQIPPPIDIPPFNQSSPVVAPVPLPSISLSSPPERTTFGRAHHHHRSHESRTPMFVPRDIGLSMGAGPFIAQPLATAGPTMVDGASDSFGIRPVREIDRLPSMLPSLQAEVLSQPESPTTPSGAAQLGPTNQRQPRRRRPSIRHQQSMSGDSDDNPADEIGEGPADAVPAAATEEPMVGIQQDLQVQEDIVDAEDAIEAGATPVRITPPGAGTADAETFNITHRSALDGSIANLATPQPATPLSIPQIPTLNVLNHVNTTPPTMNMPLLPWGGPRIANSLGDRVMAASIHAAVPRDEDVLMSLQLLAYVSKYCNLRRYFQNSHLVPGLKIGKDLALLDGEIPRRDEPLAFEDDPDNEYLLPEDLNIFPLVEKFTVRHHTQDMQYWAGVVMRNLCRKDDSRGGIRQCAYYQCGKWEEYTRQFAKCRRCRRTKYCSKDCQKSAWVYHRHWCVAAQQ